MVIDIGGGTTEVAVISLGGMVVWESIRVGGYEMDDAIVTTQERAQAADRPGDGGVGEDRGRLGLASRRRGRDERRRTGPGDGPAARVTSPPVTYVARSSRRSARIVGAVKDTLERTPPELAADLGERGIVLAGGGSLLRGIDEKLRSEIGLPVQLAESPLTCVVEGAGRSLDELETLERAAKAQRRDPQPPLDARQPREQSFDRAGPGRRRCRKKLGQPLGLLLVQ